MANFKKTLLASLIVGSSSVFAGTMGPVCVDGNVTIPCPSTGFSFEGDALYLKSSYGTDFAALPDNHVLAAGILAENTNTLHTNWNWGFKLDGAYKFDSGNDIDLNWYYFDGSNSGAYAATEPTALTTPLDLAAVNGAYNVSQRWSAVNLEFGQHMDFNKVKNIRFHAGVAYAQTKVSYYDTVTDARYGVGTNGVYSKYEGVGPRVGADLSYGLANWLTWSEVLGGWSVYGNSAVALLGGNQTFNSQTFNSRIFAPTPINVTGSRFSVVPEVELRLGTKFDYAMDQGSLGLNVGYMFVNYFQNLRSEYDDSNYALNGIYFGAKWSGNFI